MHSEQWKESKENPQTHTEDWIDRLLNKKEQQKHKCIAVYNRKKEKSQSRIVQFLFWQVKFVTS